MCVCVCVCVCVRVCTVDRQEQCVLVYVYSGTSLLRTLWDLDFSPYYRGVLNSEVTYVIHYSTTLGHRMVSLL